VALLLVATGSLSFGPDADAPLTLSKDARTRIEGFSPRTGRALWHFDAGRNVGLLEFSVPAQTGASTMVIADAAGRLRGRARDQLQVLPVMTGTVPEYRLERAGAAKTIPGGPSGRRRSRNERQTASRARPLARRAERTLRPPTVFMRARNPCVRARRIFDGW